MDIATITQIVSTVLIIAATILVSAKKPVQGLFLGSIGQITWITYAVMTFQFWLGVQSVVLFVISVWGLKSWSAHERRSRQDSMPPVLGHTENF